MTSERAARPYRLGLSSRCATYRHGQCPDPLRCGCTCHACTDTLDGMPCHGDKGHGGDHWNFYAERQWPQADKGSSSLTAPARVPTGKG